MPTFPKRPPVAPAPLLQEGFDFDEGSGGADDFLKPSEFGSGGYYDNNDGAAKRHAARRPKAFSLNHDETLMQHKMQVEEARNPKPTPQVKKVVKKVVKAVPPPPPPQQHVVQHQPQHQMQHLPQHHAPREEVILERYQHVSRSREPSPDVYAMMRSHSGSGKGGDACHIGRETNFNDIKHMMQVGSSQNRQVTHWATSFREMSEETAPRNKPLWNLNTRNAAWKSLDDIHTTEVRPRRQARRSSIPASLRKSYDDSRYEPIARAQPELNLSGSFTSTVTSSTTSSIREQLSLTRSRLQASLGSSMSHTEYSPQFPTATTW